MNLDHRLVDDDDNNHHADKKESFAHKPTIIDKVAHAFQSTWSLLPRP